MTVAPALPAQKPARPRRGRAGDGATAAILLAPALLVLAVVIVYPVISSAWLSFTDRSPLRPGSGEFIGLENYISLLGNPSFQQALGNTVLWTVVNVVAQMILGTAIAVLLDSRLRLRTFWRTVAIIPWVIPSVAAVLIWRNLYDPSAGLFNGILLDLGIIDSPVVFLGDPSTALWAVIVESIWKGTPFVMLIVLAGLQTVPDELREAAAVDGANAWTTFFCIVLPGIRPTLGLAAILTTAYTMNNFNAIWLMTGGGPLGSSEILFTFGYREGFIRWDFGSAAAVSVILFVILLAITAVHLFLLEREERAVRGSR